MTDTTVFIDGKGAKINQFEAAVLSDWHISQMLRFMFGNPQSQPAPENIRNVEIVSVLPTSLPRNGERLGVHVIIF